MKLPHQIFGVLHINIHYLYPKLDEIKLILSNNNTVDCFCVCETFLDSTFCDSEISINDYITCVRRLDLESVKH